MYDDDAGLILRAREAGLEAMTHPPVSLDNLMPPTADVTWITGAGQPYGTQVLFPASGTLSGPDREIISIYQEWMSSNGRTDEFRMYMITNDEKIYVYDQDNMDDERGLDITEDC